MASSQVEASPFDQCLVELTISMTANTSASVNGDNKGQQAKTTETILQMVTDEFAEEEGDSGESNFEGEEVNLNLHL